MTGIWIGIFIITIGTCYLANTSTLDRLIIGTKNKAVIWMCYIAYLNVLQLDYTSSTASGLVLSVMLCTIYVVCINVFTQLFSAKSKVQDEFFSVQVDEPIREYTIKESPVGILTATAPVELKADVAKPTSVLKKRKPRKQREQDVALEQLKEALNGKTSIEEVPAVKSYASRREMNFS
ncbi:hypothetical protein [Motilimonas eburnea]|uniref:hypothetical protein n=1 Tax=Motilimonas eburnea TaxID=1737488 RepID=UPI001E4C68E8|nr:hypothetical protein [Motilimonas eburnea]MCE2571686.1 hypothetical protein [Motilimonas eburnea]